MSKIKVNLTLKTYLSNRIKPTINKTSILLDKFLFDVVIYKLRRKKEYITNKGDLKKKGHAKRYYRDEIMAKSDSQLMSNFLSHEIATYGIRDKTRIENKTITEIANEILIKKLMSRTLKDGLKIYQ
jgi:hypothetical protein